MEPAHKSMLIQALQTHGSCTVTVEGESMKPFILSGDRITIKSGSAMIRPGTVAAFFNGDQLIVHRVCAVNRSNHTVIAAGDSSPGSQGIISISSIIGTVISLKRNNREHRLFFHFPLCLLALATGYLLRLLFSRR